MRRYLLPLGAFVVLLVFLGIGLRLNPREVPSPFIGKAAPHFALARLDDPRATLAPAQMLGKVWLLNVWASWCVSCQAEHPVLMGLAQRGLVPLVGLNYKDKRADAAAWLGRHGNPFVGSAFDHDGRTGIDYGVYGVPETFLIDKRGVIRFKHVGPVTEQVLNEKLIPTIVGLMLE